MKNEKGFTLAELLIVVAVIAVLVSIAIPTFAAKLEKTRESTDAANLRAAYADACYDIITNGLTSSTKGPIKLTQTGDWEYIDEIADVSTNLSTFPKSGNAYVHVDSVGVASYDDLNVVIDNDAGD